ncbi:hypothetical protein ACFQHO_16605 [Actinomadura yumaensis]|uniref:hypothetical protein n=1 Tax=Actinomadura yumaensis TaxID=111807 RepID=UPI00360F8EC8
MYSMPVSPTCTSWSAAGLMRCPAATGCAIRIADTRCPLAMTRYALASAPPRTSSTARAASAGLRSRGATGSRWPPDVPSPVRPRPAAPP